MSGPNILDQKWMVLALESTGQYRALRRFT